MQGFVLDQNLGFERCPVPFRTHAWKCFCKGVALDQNPGVCTWCRALLLRCRSRPKYRFCTWFRALCKGVALDQNLCFCTWPLSLPTVRCKGVALDQNFGFCTWRRSHCVPRLGLFVKVSLSTKILVFACHFRSRNRGLRVAFFPERVPSVLRLGVALDAQRGFLWSKGLSGTATPTTRSQTQTRTKPFLTARHRSDFPNVLILGWYTH